MGIKGRTENSFQLLVILTEVNHVKKKKKNKKGPTGNKFILTQDGLEMARMRRISNTNLENIY